MDKVIEVALSDLNDLKENIKISLEKEDSGGCLVAVNEYHLNSLRVAIRELEKMGLDKTE